MGNLSAVAAAPTTVPVAISSLGRPRGWTHFHVALTPEHMQLSFVSLKKKFGKKK